MWKRIHLSSQGGYKCLRQGGWIDKHKINLFIEAEIVSVSLEEIFIIVKRTNCNILCTTGIEVLYGKLDEKKKEEKKNLNKLISK